MTTPADKYRVILADPPWDYRNKGTNGAAVKHYPTMSPAKLCALPVEGIAARDAVLLLWCTWPQLPIGVRVLEAWGFRYVTGFPWIKIRHVDVNLDPTDPGPAVEFAAAMGTGWWVRGASEFVLIGRRGKARPPRPCPVGLLAERIEHSRKPADLYEYGELFAGPRVELFARRGRPGWDVWGDEVESDVDLEGVS